MAKKTDEAAKKIEKESSSVPPEKSAPADAQPPIVVENLLAPEFFATSAEAISLINGMISITFASGRFDQSTTPNILKKVVVSRMVMTPASAQSLAVRLFTFLKDHGFGPKQSN